ERIAGAGLSDRDHPRWWEDKDVRFDVQRVYGNCQRVAAAKRGCGLGELRKPGIAGTGERGLLRHHQQPHLHEWQPEQLQRDRRDSVERTASEYLCDDDESEVCEEQVN